LTGVLLSIKPKYVRAILDGTKQYEFRKQIFRDRTCETVFIYSSSPEKKIVARFQIGKIVEGTPDYLWEEFWDVSGISEPEFFEYFSGKENGFAIRIDELEEFAKPVDPYVIFERFVPPQSFCYVDGQWPNPGLIPSLHAQKEFFVV
jgi:predicted transcriptional regulator